MQRLRAVSDYNKTIYAGNKIFHEKRKTKRSTMHSEKVIKLRHVRIQSSDTRSMSYGPSSGTQFNRKYRTCKQSQSIMFLKELFTSAPNQLVVVVPGIFCEKSQSFIHSFISGTQH